MRVNSLKAIEDNLQRIALEYPHQQIEVQLRDIRRIAFHISLVLQHFHEKGVVEPRLCDIGGGIGLFSVGCAALGIRVILIDDFRDPVNLSLGSSVLDLHRAYGVEIIQADVIDQSPDLPPESLDAVTSFDSMEHWHGSPKRLFHKCSRALRPGGMFLLGTPNCVNLRKRLTVPLGFGKWSSMQDWYEQPIFRGHVREPDVADLLYIARDLGLVGVSIIGRNWAGYASARKALRVATWLADRALRWRPSLCSDIYLSGIKPTPRMV